MIGEESTHDSGERPVSFSSWEQTVARSLLRFDFDFEEPDTFQGMVRSRSYADIEFINMRCGRHSANRDSRNMVPGEQPAYLMTLQLTGEFRLTQDNRTAVLKPGQFTFYDSTRPATVSSSDDYYALCLKFPQKLVNTGRDLHELTATRIDADTGIAPSVWALLSKLNETMDAVDNLNRYTSMSGVMALVSSMLHSQLDGRADAPFIITREALLRQLHEFIDAHLSDPELGPQEVAAANFISVRHLHSLFQEGGVTVAAWIRSRRVDRCRRDLADPALFNVPVASIAARWGFKGASHFGQIFKAATGQTPADFRRTAAEVADIRTAAAVGRDTGLQRFTGLVPAAGLS